MKALLLTLVLLAPIAQAEEAPAECKFAGDMIGAQNRDAHEPGSMTPCRLPKGKSVVSQSTTVTLILGMLVAGALLGLLIFFGVRRLVRMGQALVIWWDGDQRSVHLSYHRPTLGVISLKGRDVILEGRGKHGGAMSTWLIDPKTGWNFTAPTRQETVEKDLKLAVASISNPESYHKAIHRNRWNDTLQAGEDGDKWKWVPIAVVAGLLGLLAILGTLAWVATHLPTPGA